MSFNSYLTDWASNIQFSKQKHLYIL